MQKRLNNCFKLNKYLHFTMVTFITNVFHGFSVCNLLLKFLSCKDVQISGLSSGGQLVTDK